MPKITGREQASGRLRGLAGREAVELVGEALFAGGEIIKAEARVSITQGSVSGKNHVPSLPGEPPNNDTGVLVSHINTIQVAPLRVQVESAAPYAVVLEKGSDDGTLIERPYMGPATRRKRKEVVALVHKAVDVAIKRAGRA